MLTYHPKIGTILQCNYPSEKQALGAEMVKPRPCIIISSRLPRSSLYMVVPLSTSVPDPIEKWHYQLNITARMPTSFPHKNPWAKCDVMNAVDFERLDRMKDGRKYLTVMASDQDLENVRNCVKVVLGF